MMRWRSGSWSSSPSAAARDDGGARRRQHRRGSRQADRAERRETHGARTRSGAAAACGSAGERRWGCAGPLGNGSASEQASRGK
jgi:hypothetical protein